MREEEGRGVGGVGRSRRRRRRNEVENSLEEVEMSMDERGSCCLVVSSIED